MLEWLIGATIGFAMVFVAMTAWVLFGDPFKK
jgi:hypothetical protein